ncbi:DUF2063 domain-containing protein [Thiomicrospira sp. WB1]|uniref:HvfC family RiPP maturation protein n=1 Tax=Thiomicrospira sp. WB1 TaxID=1685380 RepID=UPI0007484111|nr:putative DNA-binding domain-containing protein [Thiomicrospira sp. WB1]KUJ71896.1 hypothetical protein AVO41_05445 [Thiomicrospira sp. WB1]
MTKDQPAFQRLQQHFARHLRDPDQPYDPSQPGAATIETRRLNVYESLFFNNFNGLLGSMFPVMKKWLGDAQWEELVRSFMQTHGSQTPYFHKLGQEWLRFLAQTDHPILKQTPMLGELAHYEWVELAVSIEPFEPSPFPAPRIDQDPVLTLSPLVWPLHYQTPVHRISSQRDHNDSLQSEATWLLVHRDSEDKVHFAELTAPMYQLLRAFANATTPVSEMVGTLSQPLSEQSDFTSEDIMTSAAQLIPQWIEQQWLICTAPEAPHPIVHSEQLQRAGQTDLRP